MTKWFDIITVYGYEVYIPGDVNVANYFNTMHDLNGMISEPFRVYSLIKSVCNGWDEDNLTADDPFLIVGFEATELNECLVRWHELDNYLEDNPIFAGYTCEGTPKFHFGIEWLPPLDSDEDSSDEDSDEESVLSDESTSESVANDV